jgi:IS30 family transposase
MIRRFALKGTDIGRLKESDVKGIEQWINVVEN